MLRPKTPFAETRLDEVAGNLRFTGKAKSIDEMEGGETLVGVWPKRLGLYGGAGFQPA